MNKCMCGCGRLCKSKYILGHNSRDRVFNWGNKISMANKGKLPWNINKKLTKAHRLKLSKSHIGIQALEKHPNWKGGTSFEPYSIDIRRTKDIIRKMYKEVCQVCRKDGNEIHHIDYDKKNGSMNNLICLCKSCHSKTNYNRTEWITYFNKPIIVITGSEGMIGKELQDLLQDRKDIFIRCIDLKLGLDLTDKKLCKQILYGVDTVYSLVGVKGNPKMTKERPIDFMVPMLQCDTNLIECAQQNNVKRFLYTSSIAVENPESDKYPAWAKKTAEMLIEAMRIQYPEGTKYCIVRPANVYGKHDNFANSDAMVITKLIFEAMCSNKLVLDKKGCLQTRDFIHAKDVALGMVKAIEELPDYPVNLCSETETSIKEVAEIIAKHYKIKIEYKDLNLVLGPNKKLMKLNWDFKPTFDIKTGLAEVLRDN